MSDCVWAFVTIKYRKTSVYHTQFESTRHNNGTGTQVVIFNLRYDFIKTQSGVGISLADVEFREAVLENNTAPITTTGSTTQPTTTAPTTEPTTTGPVTVPGKDNYTSPYLVFCCKYTTNVNSRVKLAYTTTAVMWRVYVVNGI